MNCSKGNGRAREIVEKRWEGYHEVQREGPKADGADDTTLAAPRYVRPRYVCSFGGGDGKGQEGIPKARRSRKLNSMGNR